AVGRLHSISLSHHHATFAGWRAAQSLREPSSWSVPGQLRRFEGANADNANPPPFLYPLHRSLTYMNDKLSSSPTERAVKDAKAGGAKSEDTKESLLSLGLPESEGHKGTISIDGDVPIESLHLAYQAMREIAEEIATLVVKHKDGADHKSSRI